MFKNDSGKALAGNERFNGFCIDLLDEIARIENFNYTIYLVADGNRIK
jgi:ionotropic glutamate receptor